MPGEDSALVQMSGKLDRFESSVSQAQRGHAFGQSRRVVDSPNLDLRNLLQSIDQLLDQDSLMGGYRPIGRLQSRATVGCIRVERAAQIGQIVDGRGRAGDTFVVLGAGHPATRYVVRRRSNLVRRQLFEQTSPTPENAHVRSEKLVGRANQEVAVVVANVDQCMRRVVYGVEIDQGSNLVRHFRDFTHRIDRPHRVRRTPHRHQPRPR